MRFELPNAVAAMNNAVAAADDAGDAWEVVGEPLDRPIDEVLPAYDRALELGLDPSGGNKRLEICGLNWGRIDKDVARLNGLAAGIENISGVIRAGLDQLAHDWTGEAFDAFRAAVEKTQRTLDDYAAAVRGIAGDLEVALTGIRTAYATYRDDTLGEHLDFGDLTRPEDWRKVTDEDVGRFAARCLEQSHDFTVGCLKDNDEQKSHIVGRIITHRNYADVAGWLCQNNAGLVIGQYQQIARWAADERGAIQGKIHNWYRATDQLKDGVDTLFAEALGNLRKIAEIKPFATLAVVGGSGAPGPGPGGPDGHRPDVSGGPGPGGGGPGGGGAFGHPVDAPPDAATSPPDAATAPPDPGAAVPEREPAPAGTVQIQDAERTITVGRPDGQGHVRVTVEDAAGATRTYDLDFNTASGMGTRPGETVEQAPDQTRETERVAAGSNGKCVITDGPVTITTERSLFDEDTLAVTIASPPAPPTTYTLDFAAPDTPPPPAFPAEPAPATAGPGESASNRPAAPPTDPPADEADTATTAKNPAEAHPAPAADPEVGTGPADAAGTDPADTPGPEAGNRAAAGGVPDRGSSPDAPGTGDPADTEPAPDVTGPDVTGPDVTGPDVTGPDVSGPDVSAETGPGADPGATDSAAESPADDAAPRDTDVSAGSARPAPEPATAPGDAPEAAAVAGEARSSVPAEENGRSAGADQVATPGGTAPSAVVPDPAAAGAAGGSAPSVAEPGGRLSGVLVPEQPDGGPQLGQADAGEPAGAVGAGAAGAGAGQSGGATPAAGRAGTGWSVHGDLFDSGDPVYSMHGVLGEDDLDSR